MTNSVGGRSSTATSSGRDTRGTGVSIDLFFMDTLQLSAILHRARSKTSGAMQTQEETGMVWSPPMIRQHLTIGNRPQLLQRPGHRRAHLLYQADIVAQNDCVACPRLPSEPSNHTVRLSSGRNHLQGSFSAHKRICPTKTHSNIVQEAVVPLMLLMRRKAPRSSTTKPFSACPGNTPQEAPSLKLCV
jgi:hypothetical protein